MERSMTRKQQKKLLAKQFKVQKEYIRILEKRLKIWVDEK